MRRRRQDLGCKIPSLPSAASAVEDLNATDTGQKPMPGIGSTRWLQRVPPVVPAVPAASDPLPAAAVAAPAANTASRIALRGWKDGSPLPPRHGGSSRPAPSTARHGTPFAPTRSSPERALGSMTDKPYLRHSRSLSSRMIHSDFLLP